MVTPDYPNRMGCSVLPSVDDLTADCFVKEPGQTVQRFTVLLSDLLMRPPRVSPRVDTPEQAQFFAEFGEVIDKLNERLATTSLVRCRVIEHREHHLIVEVPTADGKSVRLTISPNRLAHPPRP